MANRHFFQSIVGLCYLGWLVLSLQSCHTVKPYQRAYLNDAGMQIGSRPIEKFSSSAHSYREGASGGGTSRTSGGCGCN
jgi:Domain of unknown function (DUF4266)